MLTCLVQADGLASSIVRGTRGGEAGEAGGKVLRGASRQWVYGRPLKITSTLPYVRNVGGKLKMQIKRALQPPAGPRPGHVLRGSPTTRSSEPLQRGSGTGKCFMSALPSHSLWDVCLQHLQGPR